MARIFISHSSLDNEAAARMKAWLASQGFERVTRIVLRRADWSEA